VPPQVSRHTLPVRLAPTLAVAQRAALLVPPGSTAIPQLHRAAIPAPVESIKAQVRKQAASLAQG